MNVTSLLAVGGASAKYLNGKQVNLLGNSLWTGGDIEMSASTITNYGTFTASSLQATLNSSGSAESFTSYGSVSLSNSSVKFEVPSSFRSAVSISSDSSLDLAANSNFYGAAVVVDGSVLLDSNSAFCIL